jgi:hypothetical protein
MVMRRIHAVIAAIMILGGVMLPDHVNAQTGQRCFEETGKCISGVIRTYWERNGGLQVFGFPITDLATETNAEGFTGPTQWFERDRLEDHSGMVMAGRLGAQKLAAEGRPWETLPKVTRAAAGCRFFAETGHSLCQPFRAYWERNGGVARFGFPISEPMSERNADGFTGTFQWFERRRMELHPENQPPFDILLGLLGKEVRNAPPTAGTACDGLAAPYNVERDPENGCIQVGGRIRFLAFDFPANSSVTVRVTNASGSNVGDVQSARVDNMGDVRISIETNNWSGIQLAPGDYRLIIEEPSIFFRPATAPFRIIQ